MNKADLVEAVKGAADITRGEAESAVDAVVSGVMSAVSSGERVTVAGFGSCNPSQRAARTGRNPQTGEPVRIAASTGFRFTPAAAFKQALNPRAAKKSAGKKSPGKKSAAAKAPAKAQGQKKQAATRGGTKKAPAKKAAKSTKKR